MADDSVYLGGSSNKFVQFASVETENWEKLDKETKIKVSLTDKDGKYSKALPITVEVFRQTFFPVADGVWKKTVKVRFDEKAKLAELTILDQNGKETNKKNSIAIRVLKQNFMPEENSP